MVLHSLQKLQVLITKLNIHTYHQRGQPEPWHSLQQNMLKVSRLPVAEGYCFQHKGNKGVDGLSVQAAILPSPGRSSLLKGHLELPLWHAEGRRSDLYLS